MENKENKQKEGIELNNLKEQENDANDSNDKDLTKILPDKLLVGFQADVNEKALKSYINSLALNLFDSLDGIVYSFKKTDKNRYLYEIHNGSKNLTYLNLLKEELFEKNKNLVILKTNGKNIKVIKRSYDKLDVSALTFNINKDEDALVDYKSKGKLKEIKKRGTEKLFFATLLFIITGIMASTSYYVRYYKLNSDYSFNPVIQKIDNPITYIDSINFKDFSKYKYIKYISFEKGKWSHKYEIIKQKNNKEKEIKKDQKLKSEKEISLTTKNKVVDNKLLKKETDIQVTKNEKQNKIEIKEDKTIVPKEKETIGVTNVR